MALCSSWTGYLQIAVRAHIYMKYLWGREWLGVLNVWTKIRADSETTSSVQSSRPRSSFLSEKCLLFYTICLREQTVSLCVEWRARMSVVFVTSLIVNH